MRRFPKWLDRAGFEADKMMRTNRVRLEASRIGDESNAKTLELGEKVLELAAEGLDLDTLDATLGALVKQIRALRAELARKEDEVKAINSEIWSENGPIVPRAADPIAQRLQAYVEAKTSDFNCPKCGTIIRANKRFCPKCGRKVLR